MDWATPEDPAYDPEEILGTIHYGGEWPTNTFSGQEYRLDSGSFHDDFHEFAIEWDPAEIRWFVDGYQYFSVTPEDLPRGSRWAYDHPFFILLNALSSFEEERRAAVVDSVREAFQGLVPAEYSTSPAPAGASTSRAQAASRPAASTCAAGR